MPDYIVLKCPPAPTRRGGRRRTAGPGMESFKSDTPPRPVIERRNMSAHAALELSRQPDRQVAPPMPIRLIAPVEPTAPAAEAAWGIAAVGALSSDFSGAGATVAVIDTGIDASHPAFAGVEIIQKDFTGDGDGDEHGHGTHCAGTILGRDVGGVRIGVAPGVKRLLVAKVFGRESSDSNMLFDAIHWAIEEGADVISMSLGFDFPGYVAALVRDEGLPVEAATSVGLEAYRANCRIFDAIMGLIRVGGYLGRDPVVVLAAGNESRVPHYTIAASIPAAALDVISVAALQEADEGKFTPTSFSNTLAVLAAPGLNVLSAEANTGKLVPMDGTSMACPHVAGVAALWWEALNKAGVEPSGINITTELRGKSRFDVIAGATPNEVGRGMVTAP